MRTRFTAIFLAIIFAFQIFSLESHAQSKGRVIMIMLNRMGMEDMLEIESLSSNLQKRGYISLMNIRGSRGTSDIRSYASIGWGTRAYLNNKDVDFEEVNDQNSSVFKRRTGANPLHINNVCMNNLIRSNSAGEYGAHPGILQKELEKSGKTISVIGNSNTDEQNYNYACLIGMDENGRVESGKIDGLNIKDSDMPFGIKSDYNALKEYTEKYYNESDVIVVELGDTYRLDLYRPNLNSKTYLKMKEEIYKDISSYMEYVLDELSKPGDRIYVVSAYPKLLQYKEFERLSPLLIFEGEGKGVLYSSTTRREGIIGNIDIASDVLDYFELDSDFITGRTIQKIQRNDNISFLRGEFEKAITTYKMRIPVLYSYAVFEMLFWILIFLLILLKDKVPGKVFCAFSEILQFTVSIPFVLLIEPAFGMSSKSSVMILICGLSLLIYIAVKKLSSGHMERLVAISVLTAAGLLFDAATGQELIKRSILGYDSMIGARYYGVGNEYMGILIGASLLCVSGLLQKKKISKAVSICILALTIVILGFPKMGANVGGTITASFCFLFFVLTLYEVRIDFKKLVVISLFVCIVVGSMASIDIFLLGSKSHLAGAIEGIISGGPVVVLQIIKRKLEMNMRLIGASIWSKVFIIALFIVGALFCKPFGMLKKVCTDKKLLKKGWSAIIIGSFVGFAVNDSGVVSAATSISFVIISVLLLIIEEILKGRDEAGSKEAAWRKR